MALFSGLLGQAQPQSGQDIINQEYQQGQQAQNQQYAQDQYMNAVQRDIANSLIKSKMAYEAAAQQEAAARAAGQASPQALAQLEGARNDAHQAADMIRGAANSIGFDASQYGADVSLKQAQQNLLENDYRAIDHLLNNDISSDQYYEREYAKLRDMGISRRASEREAGKRAATYQAGRMARLQQAMSMYGRDDRGVINPNGISILAAMGDERPDIANLYANMEIKPQARYDFENQQIQSSEAYQRAVENALRTFMQNRQLNAENNAAAADRELRKHQWDIEKADRDYAEKMQGKQDDYEIYIAKSRYLSDAEKEKARWIYNGLIERGEDPLTAYYASIGQGQKSSGRSGKGDSEDLSASQKTALGNFEGIKQEFLNLRMSVDEFKEKIAKLSPWLDEKDMEYVNDLIHLRNFLAEYKLDPNSANSRSYYNTVKATDEKHHNGFMEYLKQNMPDAIKMFE